MTVPFSAPQALFMSMIIQYGLFSHGENLESGKTCFNYLFIFCCQVSLNRILVLIIIVIIIHYAIAKKDFPEKALLLFLIIANTNVHFLFLSFIFKNVLTLLSMFHHILVYLNRESCCNNNYNNTL